MLSVVLVLVVKKGLKFWALYKMLNVTEGKTQLPRNIIRHDSLRKFRYDDYLSIFRFKLLSYMVGVYLWLGEDYKFFRLKYVSLENLPPYHSFSTNIFIILKTASFFPYSVSVFQQ